MTRVSLDPATLTLAQAGKFLDGLEAGDDTAAALASAILPDQGWTRPQIESLALGDIDVADPPTDEPDDAITINRRALTIAQDRAVRDMTSRKRVHRLVAMAYVYHGGQLSLAECKAAPFARYEFVDEPTGATSDDDGEHLPSDELSAAATPTPAR